MSFRNRFLHWHTASSTTSMICLSMSMRRCFKSLVSRKGALSRSPRVRRQSSQGYSGASSDDHGPHFYGFSWVTTECGVPAAASYFFMAISELLYRLQLVFVPYHWWESLDKDRNVCHSVSNQSNSFDTQFAATTVPQSSVTAELYDLYRKRVWYTALDVEEGPPLEKTDECWRVAPETVNLMFTTVDSVKFTSTGKWVTVVHIGHTQDRNSVNNNNRNNIQDIVYGAVIMVEPLQEFTRFIWWM